MNEPVAGKFVAPLVPAGYVPRPRLMAALDAGVDRRLTVVDAPTEYGKTMLVAAWCAERVDRRTGAFAWLSLESAESDPAQLTRYLVAALRGAGAEIGGRTEEMLWVPRFEPDRMDGATGHDLGALPGSTTLVLDDYDAVANPTCDALVRFLIEHAPGSLPVVVCTRADLPLGLGALRAAGQLRTDPSPPSAGPARTR